MNDSGSGSKDSVTEVAEEESFVRERPPDIERGTVLAGRYQIEDVIGKGGSGIVLRVFDRTAQNVVALKVLKAELARDSKWEKRFSRELRLGRPIQHPNVCRIFDIGEADGHRFLTMEIAPGGSLRDELKRGGALDRPLDAKVADARAVIAGLAALHGAGVVHRDFKPDNLLRMGDGRLVLSDFGLATDAATAPGATVLIGTPHYMAPEVLAGEPATSRSDVWALAVVLHEIFFGRRPERRSVSFDGSSKGPIRPTSPTERRVMALCERCLAEPPLDRPADAQQVARLFDSEGRSPAKGGPLRDRRVMAVFGLVAVLALSIATRTVTRHQRQTSAGPSPSSTTAAMTGAGIRLEPEGDPVDWSRSARTILDIPGRVHCFSLIDEKTVRIVWGSPRRAEDVDVESGARRVARLAPETFRVGCPELSPNRKALLFTAQTQAGASEIRVSTPDGQEAKSVTSGADPLWLGGNDEFLYSVDSSHAAVFSLPTMSFALLAEPQFGQRRSIVLNKAVSQAGNTVALLVGADNTEFGIAVYDQPPFEHAKVFAVPHPYQIQFEPRTDAVLFEYDAPKSSSTLVELDWRHDKLRSIAQYPGFDLVWSAFPGGRAGAKLLMVRHLSSDVWLYDGKKKRKLTEDGADYSADLSPSGELLVSRLGSGGTFSIWQRSPNGTERRLTSGPRDIGPAFSRDGRFWTYSDYATKSIMLCSGTTEECHVLHKDEVFPMGPRFSPDGTSIAYVSGMGSPKVMIISATDGRVLNSWDGQYQCLPVWSTTTAIWSLEVGAGRYYWSERNAVSGEKTGRRLEALAENLAVGEVQCGSTFANSPLFQPVRIEKDEISKLLVAR
jgi:hypothetical protein